jgi:hypothetical protein
MGISLISEHNQKDIINIGITVQKILLFSLTIVSGEIFVFKSQVFDQYCVQCCLIKESHQG